VLAVSASSTQSTTCPTVQREEKSVAGFKAATIRIRIESVDEGENFLRGLIVAQSNNSSPLFPELIGAVNGLLEGARREKLEADIAAREAAGM
jgi:hypothetical protein